MDRFHSTEISKESSTVYSGNRFWTQHDARQRSPALIVLKEENNNNNKRRIATWWWRLTWRLLNCRAVSHKQCARSMVSAYTVCEHLLTILLTWSLTDSLFEMVTPSILRYSAYVRQRWWLGVIWYFLSSSSYQLSQFQLILATIES